MYVALVDDSTHKKPSRPGVMGTLVGAGAICVPGDVVKDAEAALEAACATFGFPQGEEFKWSPHRKSWMYQNLRDDDRTAFFTQVIAHLHKAGAFGMVVLEDAGRNPANWSLSAEQDVIVLLLERIANRLKERQDTGLLIFDRPGGNRAQEDAFLGSCIDALRTGTAFVQHNEIALVVASDSQAIRLLQAADLLTSCITAYVAGERTYSPPVAEALKAILVRSMGRYGGYGVKIHPDYSFGNLYHWLFGDTDLFKGNVGRPMPIAGRQYAASPHEA